jgi:acetyl esterase/lipase
MARWLRLLVIPLWRRRRGVLRRRNISYGDAGRWHLLDVYEPRTAGANRPVFIHFHGGHFASGHKSREAASLLYRLASHGWVCVSANYRLRAASAFPNALIDAKRVVAWVRDHADELGADPEMLVVSGSSAGAHLAAGLALTPNQARYQPGFASSETSVAGAVGFYGYYGPVSASPDSSPVHDIGPHAPPFLVLDAGQDSYVPVNGGRSFADALRSASERPVGYAELPGAQHAFDLYDSVRFDAVSDAVEAFVDTLRTDSRSGLLTDSPDRRT